MFTVTYKTEVTAEGTFEVEIPDIEGVIREKLEDQYGSDPLTASDAEISSAVKQFDVGAKIAKDLPSYGLIPANDYELDSDLRDRLEDTLGATIEQRISAYDDGGDVDMAEYPGVYLRWALKLKKAECGKPQVSGGKYHVPLKVTWEAKPNRWALGDPRSSGDWNHIWLA